MTWTRKRPSDRFAVYWVRRVDSSRADVCTINNGFVHGIVGDRIVTHPLDWFDDHEWAGPIEPPREG